MKKQDKKQKGFVSEQYLIRYNIQKNDGYWTYGAEEDIEILSEKEKEKDNHEGAEKEFLKLHPKAEVLAVIYC
jgi:hypothetical protein